MKPTFDDLSLGDLRLFAQIALTLNLSGVARERNVPVSQVSRGLQRLEGICQTKLVHRSTHNLSLTPEGVLLQNHAQRLLGLGQELENEFVQRQSSTSGLVRVAMSTVFADYALIESLPSLITKHPQISFDLRISDTLVDMAKEGIDIALRGGAPTSDTLVMRKLGVLQRRLYAAPNYIAQYGAPPNMAQLQAHTLLASSLHTQLNLWPMGGADKARIDIRSAGKQVHFADSSSALVDMCRSGLGIARILTVVAQPLVQAGQLVEVMPGWGAQQNATPFNAYFLSGRHRLPKIKACLDHWSEWLSKTHWLEVKSA